MPDRKVETKADKIPDIDETLRAVLLAALNEARERMENGEPVVPFTALAVKDNLFLESVNEETPERCFAKARHTVQNARGASAYALCYDGYIDTDAGTQDALISEGGMPGQDTGYAIAYPYTEDDSSEDAVPKIEKDPVYIGKAPNYMIAATPYSEEELAQIGNEEEPEEETEEVEVSETFEETVEETADPDTADNAEDSDATSEKDSDVDKGNSAAE